MVDSARDDYWRLRAAQCREYGRALDHELAERMIAFATLYDRLGDLNPAEEATSVQSEATSAG